MSSATRTVRFSDLVKHFGPAHLVTLWSDPNADKTFMRAVEENRVVTIALQNVGTRKDFGLVGFDPKPSATYVVFAKPLSAAKGTRVVGLKYDLIEELPVKDPVSRSQLQPKAQPRARERKKGERGGTDSDHKIVAFPEPTPPKKFRVTLSVTAKSQVETEVEAATAKEARTKALESLKNEPVDVTNAAITRRIISTEEISD
jgi:hypothetical protein